MHQCVHLRDRNLVERSRVLGEPGQDPCLRLAAFVRRDMEKYAKIVRLSGAKVD